MTGLKDIFYTEFPGTGRPLMLVHGYTCDHTDWAEQQRDLNREHRVISVDLNGHGQSSAGTPTVEAMGEEVAALISRLDLNDVVLAGHSMGTRVVAEATTHCAERVSGLVMVDGSRGASSSEHLERVKVIRSAMTYDDYARSLFSQMFTSKTPDDTKVRVVERATAMDADWSMALHTNVAEYDAYKLPATLDRVDVPMQVIQCTTRDDQGGRRMLSDGETTEYTDFLQSHFSAEPSRVDILADVGHFPQFDAPSELNQLIRAFILDLDR